jgi:hypothetical protein
LVEQLDSARFTGRTLNVLRRANRWRPSGLDLLLGLSATLLTVALAGVACEIYFRLQPWSPRLLSAPDLTLRYYP